MRIGGLVHLPVPIKSEPRWVVDIHLDQIFVERIRATSPAAIRVHKHPGSEVEVRAQQSWERLSACWLRAQEIGLCLLCKVRIYPFPSEIRETSPFKNKRASSGNSVGRIGKGICSEVEVVGWNTGRGLEAEREPDC